MLAMKSLQAVAAILALVSSVASSAVKPSSTAVVTTSSSGVCKPTHLANGGFESGKLAPWTTANENLYGLPATTITDQGLHSKHAVNLSLIYQPSDKTNRAIPLINLSQNINACGVRQAASLHYNIQPVPAHASSLLFQIYDDAADGAYVEEYVYYNSSSTVDSLGNPYGEWHSFGAFTFIPKEQTLHVSVIIDGAHVKTMGTATVLVDNIKIGAYP